MVMAERRARRSAAASQRSVAGGSTGNRELPSEATDVAGASFFSTARLRLWFTAFVLTWLVSAVALGGLRAEEQPVDFLAFWTAGEMVVDGQVELVYDVEAHHRASETVTGPREQPVLPWLHPPHFLLVAALLGTIGYHVAFLLFVAAGATWFAWSAWRILPHRLAILGCFAFAPTAWNLQIGQVGFFMAAASCTALIDREEHPWRSGLSLAVLSFKPQFGLVIGAMLVVTRSWRALASGIFLSFGLVGSSVVLFGADRWTEFLDRSRGISTVTDLISAPYEWKSQSVFGLFRSAQASEGLALSAHLIAVAIVLVALVGVWRRAPDSGPAWATVLVASILISPRALPYDLQILALAGLFLLSGSSDSPERIARHLAFAAGAAGLMLLNLPGGLIAATTVLWVGWAEARRQSVPTNPGVIAV